MTTEQQCVHKLDELSLASEAHSVDVEAPHRRPEVAPLGRQHAGAHGVPRRQEGQDVAAKLVREAADSISRVHHPRPLAAGHLHLRPRSSCWRSPGAFRRTDSAHSTKQWVSMSSKLKSTAFLQLIQEQQIPQINSISSRQHNPVNQDSRRTAARPAQPQRGSSVRLYIISRSARAGETVVSQMRGSGRVDIPSSIDEEKKEERR